MEIKDFANRLKRSIGRNGVMYIASFNSAKPVNYYVELLRDALQTMNISASLCDLRTGETPRQTLESRFQHLVRKNEGRVLLVWSMEHQNENELREFLRWLNKYRAKWGQVAQQGELTIPVVFMSSHVTYRDYIGRYAYDLCDCAHKYIFT